MAILLIGDLHADKLCHVIPQFTRRVCRALTRTVEDVQAQYALEHIVIAGDIFDSATPTQSAVVDVLSVLSSLPAPVHLLLGNHDYGNTQSHSLLIAKWVSTQKNSNIRVIDQPETLRVDDHEYLLLPHPYVEDLPDRFTAGIGHFAVNGAKADNGFKVRSSHNPKGRWYLGDFHTSQVGHVKSCHYEYIGSLTQLAWEESHKKSVLVLDDGDAHRIPARSTYRMVKRKIASLDDLNAIEDKPRTYYKLQTENFSLPVGYLSEHPNVLKVAPISKKKDRRAAVLLENSEYVLDPLKSLPSFLEGKKYDANVSQRAVEIAKELKIA